MSVPSGEHGFPYELEIEAEAEVALVEASHPEEVLAKPITDWLFDPVDAERAEIGLRGLLGAVQALEDDSRPDGHGA
ncbi:hypothetical protein Misp01_71970 [Microtetraspora sp. NBRC 13810]|uniref:hypothetical protein n=1 Tax=Microtetraspora sp. NBRC 13810 TaxID=3030990 RepID=UPI0024A2E868|nr:hypothetical protein [Microtetraspora sp. NBRC 13810]GLW12069.1 hypothetical protein Misp01_71970 [Microtetraspora sp. NBRC 13810]